MAKTLLHSLIFPRFLALGVEPMTMMALAAAASALGNFFGAKSEAKTQAEAKARTDANNLRMFQESRGSTGSAVLPEYLKPYEADLARSAAQTAQAMFGYGGGPAGRLAEAEGTLARYEPSLRAGDELVFDLASGKLGRDRRAALEPVLGARTAVAKSRAAAIAQGLDETLATLRAQRAGTGFRGSSTFDLNRMLAATTGARGQAALGLTQADLDNALAVQGLQENDLQMRLAGLELPYQLGAQRLNFQNLPAQSLAQFYQNALAPLSFFRLPTANAPYQTANPVASTGQIAGSAVAGLGNTLGQYYAQQAMMEQLRQMYQAPASYLGNNTWVGAGGDPGPVTISGGIPGLT